MANRNVDLDIWTPDHPRWGDLLACVEREGQRAWLEAQLPFHLGSYVLVALQDGEIIGFLRFALQQIGPEADCPPLLVDGEALIEAKILAFGVVAHFRNQGIGTALQRNAIAKARALGCYQVRSWSLLKYRANHRLKLKLGFCAQPERRANGQQGFYYLLPLKPGL